MPKRPDAPPRVTRSFEVERSVRPEGVVLLLDGAMMPSLSICIGLGRNEDTYLPTYSRVLISQSLFLKRLHVEHTIKAARTQRVCRIQ